MLLPPRLTGRHLKLSFRYFRYFRRTLFIGQQGRIDLASAQTDARRGLRRTDRAARCRQQPACRPSTTAVRPGIHGPAQGFASAHPLPILPSGTGLEPADDAARLTIQGRGAGAMEHHAGVRPEVVRPQGNRPPRPAARPIGPGGRGPAVPDQASSSSAAASRATVPPPLPSQSASSPSASRVSVMEARQEFVEAAEAVLVEAEHERTAADRRTCSSMPPQHAGRPSSALDFRRCRSGQ